MTNRISDNENFKPEAVDLSMFSATDKAKKEALDKMDAQRESSKSASKKQAVLSGFLTSHASQIDSRNSTL